MAQKTSSLLLLLLFSPKRRDLCFKLFVWAGPAAAAAPAAAASPAAQDAGEVSADAAPAYGWFGKDKGEEEGDGEDDRQPGFLTRLGTRVADLLGGVVGDAAVLEVKTYTGDDLTAIAAGEALRGSGARLRAYTRCELYGDTESCVPLTPQGEVDGKLWAVHVEMVKQAQAHREELLKIVLSLFSSKVK